MGLDVKDATSTVLDHRRGTLNTFQYITCSETKPPCTTPFSAHLFTQSVKFDVLCTNFEYHEDLDAAEATVTMTVQPNGTVPGMTLSSVNAAGVIPITIPVSMGSSVSEVAASVQPVAASVCYSHMWRP